MNVEQVDERIAAAVQAKREHNSKVADVLAQDAIDGLLELRQQLTDAEGE